MGFDLFGMSSFCDINMNIVNQRPGLENLLLDNTASLEDQMDGEDEAFEELAQALITNSDLDGRSCLKEVAEGIEAEASRVTNNDSLPFTHCKRLWAKLVQYKRSELDRDSKILDRYCLLLLHSERGASFDSTYSIITDDYFTLQQDGSVGENKLYKELVHANMMQLPA